ncbi:ExeA family protein [Thermomonas carbonis]|uniref:AAA family ATPase n=1 Tax=Thermomonas carbonis TaxID=1463158 RepID=A0A7G9SMC3_9GAMM|nr:ExeA family protein [Thermomonas carbonis]QNN68998.1 AAA family ATPase [Thermomonas carbonis]
MYLGYYGLHEAPFSITPDPRFVHLSERHRDALAHLLFGIDKGGGGGFVQLTGEVGTGKTTLSRLLLEQLPENARIALVLNPRQNAIELLESICEELRIDIEGKRGSAKALVDALNVYLLDAYAQGLRVVLLIDEAQNLPADALEQVRLLTNLETDTQKLLQILLLGQPELREMVARPELRQLAQRITARFHLTPLDAKDTRAYLRHRWRVAGGTRFPFDAGAVQRLHARAGGVPRLVNVIAERALLAGYARDATLIDAKLVDAAADEVLPPVLARRSWPWLAAAVGVIAIALVAGWAWRDRSAVDTAAPAATRVASTTPAASLATVDTLDAAALAQLLGATGDTPLPAWQHLLGLWSLLADAITVDPAGPCTPIAQAEVHCVQGRARLDTLLALDRPILLRLQDGRARAWAVLLGADARNARLRIGTRTIDLDRVVLQSRWNGDYAGLWRGPAILSAPLRPDSTGPAVDWVRQQLSPTGNVAPGVPYNDALRASVRQLQDARGLPADGIAGPLTLMALADDPPGPRLLRVLD